MKERSLNKALSRILMHWFRGLPPSFLKTPPVLLVVTLLFLASGPFSRADAAQALAPKSIPGGPVTLHVVLDDNYPPYIFRSSVGKLDGYLVDYWALWEKKTGVQVNLFGTDWIRAQQIMKNGQADVIDTVFWTAERAKTLDYGQPYSDIQVPIYVRNGLHPVKTLEDLKDLKIGAKEGDACLAQLKKAGVRDIVLFRNYDKVIQAAAEGMLDVFCVDAPPADYLLRKAGLRRKFQKAVILYTGQFHFAVKKGARRMMARLQRGDASIGAVEKTALRKKWLEAQNEWKVDWRIFGWVLSGVLAFAALMGAWVRLLRREVRQRTLLLEGERRNLHLLIETIPDLVWLKDLNGVYLACNPMFEKVVGVPRDQIIGKKDEDFVSKENAENFRLRDLVALESDKPVLNEEWVTNARDGVRTLLETVKTPVHDGMGRLIGVLGIARDITAQRKARDEQRKLETKVQHAQKLESLGVLAGGIAHDFNNLLTSILGNADLALERLSPAAPAQENLKSIVGSARRAAELCRQLLAYSGKGRFQVQPLDLRQVVEEIAHLLSVSISKRVVLKYDFGDPIPAVEGDTAQIRQVVMNLIINASEAIGDQGGVIRIATGVQQCDREYLGGICPERELESGKYVTLEVTDTGCGMDPEAIKKIFDPFYTTKFTGRGLGLAAVRGIMCGHNGTVKVYSEPGKGSTFKLFFPACEAEARAVEPVPVSVAWKGSGKVLLVDDEAMVLEVGRRMLQKAGLTVVTARDGEQALEVFRREPDIRCVVLDLTMPKMDGETCFKEMKRLQPGVKVVLSSGYNEQHVVDRFVGKGLAGFVQKPYVAAELLAQVRRAFEGGTEK